MKIIVFFALASASICWGSEFQPVHGTPPYPIFHCDSPYINNYGANKTCLQRALATVPKLLVAGNTLICKHYWCQMNRRFEFYEDFTNEVKEFLKCAGCEGDGMLGLGNTLEATGAQTGDILAAVFPTIAEIIHHIPLVPQLLDMMCYLLNDAFTSKCLPLITYNANILVKDLNALSCQKKQKKLDPKTLVEIMKNAGCLGDKLIKIDYVLEHITEDDGNALAPVVSQAADSVLDLPVVGGLVKTITCLLNNLLGSG